MYHQDSRVLPEIDESDNYNDNYNEDEGDRINSKYNSRRNFYRSFLSFFLRTPNKYKDSRNANNSENESEDPVSSKGIFRMKTTKAKFVYPPLPKSIGQTSNIKDVIERNNHARRTMQDTMEVVSMVVKNSIASAEEIPVAKHGERVVVNTNIYDSIGQSRTKKDIAKNLRNNITEIESALLCRQTILELMNSNVDGVLVAQVAPVDINNARSITYTK